MNVAVVGYGLQGVSAAEYWHNLGHSITICDQNTLSNTPQWAQLSTGAAYLESIHTFDLIVRSPSVHPQTIVAASNPTILKKVTTTTNEFFNVCPTPNIIGVTGSKGKGTTCTLIAGILRHSGHTVHVGGNIGIDPLRLLNESIQPQDWVVLELANFQLIDIKASPAIGVCLMVTPEHLDWHKDENEYYTAKKQLFIHQKNEDTVVYNADNAITSAIVQDSKARHIPYSVPHPPVNRPQYKQGAYVEHDMVYFQDNEICDTSEVLLHGHHNLENVCAAIAATWNIIKGDTYAIKKALSEFKGLEHRLERVEEIDGVEYYNDSFATTPEASIAAIRSFMRPKVLIVGGGDKRVSLKPLVNEILASNVRHVIAIGETGYYIASELSKNHYRHVTTNVTTMHDIVQTARDVAKKGDVVLLSTGCSSFGLFKDYKDRGNQFKKNVLSL